MTIVMAVMGHTADQRESLSEGTSRGRLANLALDVGVSGWFLNHF
jgi:hypothetical protein